MLALYRWLFCIGYWKTVNLGTTHAQYLLFISNDFDLISVSSMLTEEWQDIFAEYHTCDKPTNIKIFHRNGCGPTPQACNHQLSNTSLSQIHDLNLNIEGVWQTIAELPTLEKTFLGNLNKLSFLFNDNVIMNCVIEAKKYCLGIKNLKIPLN